MRLGAVGALPAPGKYGSLIMNVGIIYNSFAYKQALLEEVEMRETAFAIGRCLAHFGHHCVQYFDIDNPGSIADLCRSPIDVAFDACERVHDDARGEAYAAALLEYLGIPHTRTSSWLVALGISKVRIRSILTYYGITSPNYQVFETGQEPLRPDMHFPLFVKGVACENSIGIDEHSLVKDLPQLRAKVDQIIRQYAQPALVEEFIDGREFSVAILPGKVNHVLPITEILFDGLPRERRFLDYTAKWHTQSEKYRQTTPVCPAPLADDERQIIGDTALRCFSVLGLDSYTRIDMRYRRRTPYILEVNQNPSIGMEDSGYVRTCNNYGLDYQGMIEALLQNAFVKPR
jgi:D-alanine-D-alanine ligase